MIPGVLKGVIASSWLRASDQLRAPNGITTGQQIPEVAVSVLQVPRAENFYEFLFNMLMTRGSDANFSVTPLTLVRPEGPMITRISVVALLRKVP